MRNNVGKNKQGRLAVVENAGKMAICHTCKFRLSKKAGCVGLPEATPDKKGCTGYRPSKYSEKMMKLDKEQEKENENETKLSTFRRLPD